MFLSPAKKTLIMAANTARLIVERTQCLADLADAGASASRYPGAPGLAYGKRWPTTAASIWGSHTFLCRPVFAKRHHSGNSSLEYRRVRRWGHVGRHWPNRARDQAQLHRPEFPVASFVMMAQIQTKTNSADGSIYLVPWL